MSVFVTNFWSVGYLIIRKWSLKVQVWLEICPWLAWGPDRFGHLWVGYFISHYLEGVFRMFLDTFCLRDTKPDGAIQIERSVLVVAFWVECFINPTRAKILTFTSIHLKSIHSGLLSFTLPPRVSHVMSTASVHHLYLILAPWGEVTNNQSLWMG
jgi:hypothetical protein